MTDHSEPAQDASQFRVSDYLQVLRRRWRLVALVVLLVAAAAIGQSLTTAKQYDAAAKLLFQRNGQADTLLDPGTGSQPSPDPERDANTDVALIKLKPVADRVRRAVGAGLSADQLLSKVDTSVEGTSNIASVTARDSSPARAARIANAFAKEYVAFRRQSARSNLDEAARLARSQLDALGPAGRDSAQGRQLQARLRELQINAALQTGGVEVVSPASRPASPSRPRPLLSAVLGLLLGLLLGALAALGLEFIDRRLKDEEAIEAVFELPILGSIPRPPRRAARGDDRGQREAYGLLAANLRMSVLQGDARALMITSSSPLEGKTSVTLGLARALAMIGQRVIAIEADLRRPGFGRLVEVPPSHGLGAVLAGHAQLADEVVWLDAATARPVTLDRLDEGLSFGVLPAGRLPANPQRALARPSMAAALVDARSLADVVLIDTAPIGTVNDAISLINLVDAAVVIARLNATTRDAARRMLRVLHNVDVRLAGLVVTGAPESGVLYYDSELEAGEPAAAEAGQPT